MYIFTILNMLLYEHMASTVFYSGFLVSLGVTCLAAFDVSAIFYRLPESKLLFFR